MRPADRTTILLLLQSMAFLPLLVFFTKGTTVMLVFTLIAVLNAALDTNNEAAMNVSGLIAGYRCCFL